MGHRSNFSATSRGTIVLGVGGGIAAYKAGDLTRRLLAQGFEVRVAMTRAAQDFVRPLTFQALSGHPVLSELSDPAQDAAFGHLALARAAALVIVAPATADLLAKLALGLCDDAVTTTVVAARAKVLVCPAMNTAMWENRQVQANLALLSADPRMVLVGPGVGLLADGDVGAGRLAEVPEIVDAALAVLGLPRLAKRAPALDLIGRKLLVTAGPTRESLDPVRFLSNPSTGRMGFALAAAAARRGAEVVLVAGPVALAAPAGVTVVKVSTAEQMRAAALAALPGAAAVVAAAAVSDYRPAVTLPQKKKKSEADETWVFTRTPDVLLALSQAAHASRPRPWLVGFAAETEDLVENARRKLLAKRLDLVVANLVGQPGSGFAADDNEVVLVDADGEEPLARMPKPSVAERILDRVAALLARG